MRILALDGAGPTAVVACSWHANTGGTVVAKASRNEPMNVELLPLQIGRCLAAAAWQLADVDVVACNIGPGGFTSIRTVVAATRGLALAGGRQVLAITSFQALVTKARRTGILGNLTAVIAAGRNEWLVQSFDHSDKAGSPQILSSPPTASLGMIVSGIDGSGARGLITDAEDIAGCACALLERGERPVEGNSLTPFYLRSADVRLDAGRSLLDRVAV